MSASKAQKTDRKAFEADFPDLVEDVLSHIQQYNVPQNAMDWFKKVLSKSIPDEAISNFSHSLISHSNQKTRTSTTTPWEGN